MKVLVVDEEHPFPLNSGKRIRTVSLLRELCGRHEVFFLHRGEIIATERNTGAGGLNFLSTGEKVPGASGVLLYVKLLGNIFSPYPFSVSKHFSTKMSHTIVAEVRKRGIDLIHCEWTPLARNLYDVVKEVDVPVLLVAHNVENVIWKRMAENSGNPIERGFFHLQYLKFRSYEKELASVFPHCVAVSPDDARLLTDDLGFTNVSVVENGVDIDYFRASETTEESPVPRTIVFTGAMDWRPNIDAALFFIRDILPLIRAQYPDSRFVVAGRNPSGKILNAASRARNVVVTGTVADIRPYLRDSAVVAVPLRIGGGSRLKILEALSMRMPVVSTTIGAEGLETLDQKELLLADSPRAFADAILRLFRDGALAETLGKNGRELVERRYSWQTLSRKLESAWEGCMASGTRRGLRRA